MEKNEDRKIEIGPDTLKELNTTRKWALFISFTGFAGTGAFLITGLITGVFLSVFKTSQGNAGFPEWMSFIIIAVLTLVFLLPVLFLFRFSKFTSAAVKEKDSQKLHKALQNLKKSYIISGILIIVFLALYMIILIATSLSMGFIRDIG